MKNTVLVVIAEPHTGWEYALIASALREKIADKPTSYVIKTVSVTNTEVRTYGGFLISPDYNLDEVPSEYAGVILAGGHSWRTVVDDRIVSLAKKAFSKNKMLGAIGNAVEFLGMHGLLNEKKTYRQYA